MDVQSNWWEQFFEGLSVKLWLQALSPESTRREADVIERALAATSGARLLDVPCGGGRLSLVLAERGYRVTGVDVSCEFLEHARSCPGADRVTGHTARCGTCRGRTVSTAHSVSGTASATWTTRETPPS